MARPAIIVDETKVRELAAKGYRLKEIAALVHVSYRTMRRRFGHCYRTGRNLMCGAIRAKQFEVAMGNEKTKPNPIMLMYFGKVECGQQEKQQIHVKSEKTVRMVVGIDPAKIAALTNGYLQPQLPSEAESITVEPEPELNGPESIPDEARDPKTKKSEQKCASEMTATAHQSQN